MDARRGRGVKRAAGAAEPRPSALPLEWVPAATEQEPTVPTKAVGGQHAEAARACTRMSADEAQTSSPDVNVATEEVSS